MKTTTIYCLINEDGIPFYIGKSNNINQRKYNHKRKYGFNVILEILDNVDIEEWRFWETYYINLYKSWGFKLENKNNGGGGLTNVIFNKDRNMKISIAQKGKSKSHKGRKFSKEHKAKIKANRGHLKGRKNTWQIKPILQYDLNGKYIKEWESQTAAQTHFKKPNGDGIGAVCRKEQKTAYGYIWKFKKK